MGLNIIIPAIYICGLFGSMALAYHSCTKGDCSVEQAAFGSSMLGYIIGSIVGLLILYIAKG